MAHVPVHWSLLKEIRLNSPDEEEWFNFRGPSKSSRKRESTGLQDLGEELMSLSPQQLERLDLPEGLKEAVLIGQGIKAHGGLARQRKYIGKLLRAMDASSIRDGLMTLRGESAAEVRLQHQAEMWRERMIEEGDGAVNDFVGRYPDADRQRLRQWVKDARMESTRSMPPKSSRLLFKAVRDHLVAEVGLNEGEHPDE